MDTVKDYFIWLADAEFSGGSMNGPTFIETLESLSAEEASSTDTYEGYTAWGVTLHTLYFKYKVGLALGAKMPEYTYDDSAWPSTPDGPDEAKYKAMIEDFKGFHRGVVDAFTAASEDRLAEEMPGWKMPIGKAFAWLVAHDTNHYTQIRNMGLASLKSK